MVLTSPNKTKPLTPSFKKKFPSFPVKKVFIYFWILILFLLITIFPSNRHMALYSERNPRIFTHSWVNLYGVCAIDRTAKSVPTTASTSLAPTTVADRFSAGRIHFMRTITSRGRTREFDRYFFLVHFWWIFPSFLLRSRLFIFSEKSLPHISADQISFSALCQRQQNEMNN